MTRLMLLRKYMAVQAASRLILVVGMILVIGFLITPIKVNADGFHGSNRAFVGTYLLTDEADIPNFPGIPRQRLVTLSKDGNFFSTVQRQTFVNFDDDRGTWKRTDRNEITAVSISFDYDVNTGVPTGATRDVYVMIFASKERGKFQTVIGGNVTGEGYELGRNPLDPDEIPIFMFSVDFTGQRVTFEE